MSKKKPAKPEAKKAWDLTLADVLSVNDAERAFGTTKLLPPEDEIPAVFYQAGNIYHRIAEAMWAGEPLPNGDITINEAFKDAVVFTQIQKCVMAHLTSFQPSHEHKIAGVAYMISKIMYIIPILTK